MQAVGFFPGQEHLGGAAGLHGQSGSHRDGIAQAHGALGAGHAHPLVSLTAVELARFVDVVAQGP